MIKLEIFDEKTLTLKDMCFQFESVKVKRKFRGVGTIETVLNSLEEGNKFDLGNYILFKDETYIVENIHKYKEASGIVKIEVSGRHINQLLANRVLLPMVASETGKIADLYNIVSSKSYQQIAVEMVKRCFTNLMAPYNTGEWLERIAPIEFAPIQANLFPEADAQINAPVYLTEALNDVLSHKKLGYCLKVDYEEKKYFFHVYEPKTKDVVFSETYGNINDADIYLQNTDEKTKSIFANNETLTYQSNGTNASGFERKELLSTDSSLSWKEENKQKLNASFDVFENKMFEYRIDYDLGDIVFYENRTFNITTQQQIAEIEEQYDTLETVSISIGDFIPTIYDRLKGV